MSVSQHASLLVIIMSATHLVTVYTLGLWSLIKKREKEIINVDFL